MQTKRLIGILALGLQALTPLLVLACLFAPGAQAAAPNQAQPAQETMPDGLMSAFLASADGYRYVEQKVIASDGAADDRFGWSVALDGDMALVGVPDDDVGANSNQGSAYVFTRSGTTWSQQQKLTAADGGAYDAFGYSVALSGNTAVVGAPADDVGANAAQGSAYVFTRSGATWGQRDKLTALDGAASDQFGWSVALDGATVLVGAPYDDVGANADQGSAYVFTPGSGIFNWEQQAKLTAADGAADDWFGWSVALDGDTALVGAYGDDVGANEELGSAYVFTRSGTTWSQQAQLTAADGAVDDRFGWSVALDGDTALVGAPASTINAQPDQGAAYAFTRSETTWSQRQKLTAADGEADDRFGWSVALDGDTALVGALGDDVSATNQGSAYVFTGSGATWSQRDKLIASDGAAEDAFGLSVALSGNTALVGAPMDDVGANAAQGSAYFFKSLVVYLPLVIRQ